jgi:hypothetical protein
MPRRIAISQSNYIPWRGYFDLIDRVDEFVVLDDVQYTRQDWRNRNRIKTAKGPAWISVAVKGRFGQRIDETLIADPSWAEKHWSKLEQEYRGAACFDALGGALRAEYERLSGFERLTDINRALIDFACAHLGVTTPLRESTEFETAEDPTDRLVGICGALGADVYLSGPTAQAYLDESRFAREGIAVEWMSYDGYPEYPQLHGPFEPRVSVVDLLLNTGEEAGGLLRPDRSWPDGRGRLAYDVRGPVHAAVEDARQVLAEDAERE